MKYSQAQFLNKYMEVKMQLCLFFQCGNQYRKIVNFDYEFLYNAQIRAYILGEYRGLASYNLATLLT
jgi:hypothetical protein